MYGMSNYELYNNKSDNKRTNNSNLNNTVKIKIMKF